MRQPQKKSLAIDPDFASMPLSRTQTQPDVDPDFAAIPISRPTATQSEQPSQFGKGLARTVLGQGLAFGFGDEAEAAVLRKPGESYEDALKRIRGEIGEYREAYPKTAIAGELAGGLVRGRLPPRPACHWRAVEQRLLGAWRWAMSAPVPSVVRELPGMD
jgi:hypothetical protein